MAIKKRGNKFIVTDSAGKKVLGVHKTRDLQTKSQVDSFLDLFGLEHFGLELKFSQIYLRQLFHEYFCQYLDQL